MYCNKSADNLLALPSVLFVQVILVDLVVLPTLDLNNTHRSTSVLLHRASHNGLASLVYITSLVNRTQLDSR